jgi:hypothetical protein
MPVSIVYTNHIFFYGEVDRVLGMIWLLFSSSDSEKNNQHADGMWLRKITWFDFFLSL